MPAIRASSNCIPLIIQNPLNHLCYSLSDYLNVHHDLFGVLGFGIKLYPTNDFVLYLEKDARRMMYLFQSNYSSTILDNFLAFLMLSTKSFGFGTMPSQPDS